MSAEDNTPLVCSFPPSAMPDARILILGSMPGAESLRKQQYYAFPHNAFWRIMGEIWGFAPDLPYLDRLAALRHCGVALWDVLASCERAGSLDTAIARPIPNDISGLLRRCPGIRIIGCNGGASGRYLKRFFPDLEVPVVVLPSTSPAAARLRYADKVAAYRDALLSVL